MTCDSWSGDENSNTESNICFNDSRSEEEDREQQTKSKTTFIVSFCNKLKIGRNSYLIGNELSEYFIIQKHILDFSKAFNQIEF